jgi:hypothetical protein
MNPSIFFGFCAKLVRILRRSDNCQAITLILRERMSSKKTSPLLSVRSQNGDLHPGPFFFVERVLVLTRGAPQSTPGIRIAVAGLLEWFHAAVPTPFVAKLSQANRWLKCQPSSYVRLEAYGFFGLSEGIGLTRRRGAACSSTWSA